MKKKTQKPKLTGAEATEINQSWDKYASEVKASIKAGTLDPLQAVALGIMLDTTAEDAKTDYVTESMLELAVELIKHLNSMPSAPDTPPDMLAQKEKAAEEAMQDFLDRITALKAPALAEKAEAEKAHVKAEAGGIFANVTLGDILNAKSVEGLPNF